MLDLQPILDKIQVQLTQAVTQRMEMDNLIQQLTGRRDMLNELVVLQSEEVAKEKKKK